MKSLFCAYLIFLSLQCSCHSSVFAQWSTANLSLGRQYLSSTSLTNKALFAGGYYYTSPYVIVSSDRVDIYDGTIDQWSTAALSIGRSGIGTTSTDSLAFFAGGRIFINNGSIPTQESSARVDIYNSRTSQWATAQLSLPRADIVAANAMGKVLFAGGDNSRVVDIYDVSTNQWSVSQLPRVSGTGLCATSIGSKIYLVKNGLLDIYDVVSGQWSTDIYPQNTAYVGCISSDTKAFFAGGRDANTSNPTNQVNIYNQAANQWMTSTLSQARDQIATTKTGGKLFFAAGFNSNVLDIYDEVTNQWSANQLPSVSGRLVAASTNNRALFAGNGSTVVDVYTVSPAVTCQSVQSGSWSEVSTWSCGHVPRGSDLVIINAGHTVTIPDGDYRAKKVTYTGGTLRFLTASSRLFLGNN